VLNNRPAEALAAAENAITADPFSADAWALRALAQDRNGDYPAAIASARHALELAGETQPQAAARAGAYLAEALYDLQYYERAFNTVNRALQADPDSPEALRVRALIYELARYDFDAALADLQRAHELAPHLPYITIDLALLHHYRFEDVDTAIALLGDLVELNPRNSAALYALGTLYLRALGDQGKASDYFSRCIESNARNSSCHYMLGRAQERSKQYSSAAASFRRAIETGPENAYHYWWAANVEILQGNCVTAIPWLQHGYRLAQTDENEELVGNYEYLMESCGLLALPGAAPNQG